MPTPAELQDELAMYKKAEREILLGAQQYEVAGRKITKATLFRVQEKIADLERRIAMLTQPMHGNVVFGARR